MCNACLFTSFDSLYIHNLSITMNLHINPHTHVTTDSHERKIESVCEENTDFVNPSKYSNVNSSSTGGETEKQWMRVVGCVWTGVRDKG